MKLDNTKHIFSNIGVVSIVIVVVFVAGMYFRGSRVVTQTWIGAFTQMQELGDLVALSAFFKEIGDFKEETPRWGGTPRRLLLICEFDIEYRFDLRKAKSEERNGIYFLELPPCKTKTSISSVRFYDERKGFDLLKELSTLWPLFGGGITDFTPEERTKMIQAAVKNATDAANSTQAGMLSRAQESAKRTLVSVARGLGVEPNKLRVSFDPAGSVDGEVIGPKQGGGNTGNPRDRLPAGRP